MTDDIVDEAKRELAKVKEDWMARPGVTAVDIGLRMKDGVLTDEVAIRVHVRRKLARSAVPEGERFPTRLGDVPIDVIEAAYGLETPP